MGVSERPLASLGRPRRFARRVLEGVLRGLTNSYCSGISFIDCCHRCFHFSNQFFAGILIAKLIYGELQSGTVIKNDWLSRISGIANHFCTVRLIGFQKNGCFQSIQCVKGPCGFLLYAKMRLSS
jgi:hypothetical protein